MAIQLSTIASHPEFVKILQEIEQAPSDERGNVAKELANVEAMAERGIPVPDTFRATTRVFEDPDAPLGAKPTLPPPPRPPTAEVATICLSLGFIICASVGANTTPAQDPQVIVSGPGDEE
jgi:hypothetical protein